MIVYILSCAASALVAYLGLQKTDRESNHWYIVVFSALPMILVAAFRYDVGEDYLHTYLPYFESLANGTLPANQKMELLYHVLNAFIVWLHGDSFWVFAICAVLFYTAVYSQIIKESSMPVVSIVLLTCMGYVFVFFNAMRQMVGCAFLLFSLRFVKSRKIFPFIACVALASGFHISCALFALVYFFPKIKIKPILAIALSIIVIVMNELITLTAQNIIAMTKYGLYISSVFDTKETAYVMLGINAVLLVFFSLCYRDNPQYQLYYNMQLIALWITIFSGKIVLVLRLMWMFGLPSIIALPMAMDSFPQKRDRKLGASIVCLLYLAYILYTVGIQNSNNVLPYQTIFSRWL